MAYRASQNQNLIRRLVALKLWQARDSLVPERLMQKSEDERDFDWNDLRQLLRRGKPPQYFLNLG